MPVLKDIPFSDLILYSDGRGVLKGVPRPGPETCPACGAVARSGVEGASSPAS